MRSRDDASKAGASMKKEIEIGEEPRVVKGSVWRKRSLRRIVGAAAMVLAGAAHAAPSVARDKPLITGVVSDATGAPVVDVMVTVSTSMPYPKSVTVFSGADGTFNLGSRELDAVVGRKDLSLQCLKLGYLQGEDGLPIGLSRLPARVTCAMKTIGNVAEQVPASAWLDLTPNNEARHVTTKQCAQCHQLPFPGVRNIASATKDQTPSEREVTWHGIVNYMRQLSTHVAGPASRRRFDTLSTAWRADPESAFLGKADEDVLAGFLARNLPTDYSHFDPARYTDATPVGAAGTVISSYYIEPSLNGWYREVMTSATTRFVWGVDLGQDRLLKLDPNNGSFRWITIPGKGPLGPHTITPDADGRFWVSLEEINGFGIFDPVTTQWRIFADVLPRGFISHDFATGIGGRVARDTHGRVWITIVSHNHLAAVDPRTGKSQIYQLPARVDGAKSPTLPYGAVMTSDGKHVWFSQHNAHAVGSVNTETGEVDFMLQLPRGTAPRRMSIGDNDVIWVALSGSSQVLELDAKSKRFVIHDLPDRGSSPYNVVWDPLRKDLWVGTTNADKIYQFNPRAGTFKQYPLPHQGAYLRMLSIDPHNGDVWSMYANKTGEKAPTWVVRLHPGAEDSVAH
jgi:streptogramin lyase